MSKAKKDIRLICPKCKGCNITSNDIAFAESGVSHIKGDGEIVWDGDTDYCPDEQKPIFPKAPLLCQGCGTPLAVSVRRRRLVDASKYTDKGRGELYMVGELCMVRAMGHEAGDEVEQVVAVPSLGTFKSKPEAQAVANKQNADGLAGLSKAEIARHRRDSNAMKQLCPWQAIAIKAP